jgi:hypothetical protein
MDARRSSKFGLNPHLRLFAEKYFFRGPIRHFSALRQIGAARARLAVDQPRLVREGRCPATAWDVPSEKFGQQVSQLVHATLRDYSKGVEEHGPRLLWKPLAE